MRKAEQIDLKSLKYFVVVAQTGNIGRAASILDVHPATLGRIIASFEKELGFELYKRHSKGIVLTIKGKDLLTIGPDILRNVERIYEVTEKFTVKQSLVVGIPFSLGPLLLGLLYSSIKSNLPATDVAFFESDSFEIETRVINGHIDVALLYDPPDVYGLLSEPLVEEAILFVYPPKWNFVPPERSILLREVQEFPIILAKMGLSERRYIGRIEQQSGIRLVPIMEGASQPTINSVVNSGLACTIALAHSVNPDVSRGSLMTHPIGRPPLKMTLNVVASKGVLDNTSVPVVMSCFRQTIETLVRAGKWMGADLIPR